MAIYKEDIVDIDLAKEQIIRSFVNHSIGMGDKKADHFGVRVFRNGEAVDLENVAVEGFFRSPNGENIAITSGNHVNQNVAYVVLPQACYNYEGKFTLAIKLVGSSVTGTMRIVDGVVDNTNTGAAVAPTSDIPTYQEILALYEEMLEVVGGSVRHDIDQDLSSTAQRRARNNIKAVATNSVANDFSFSSTYQNGRYRFHDNKLYRSIVDIDLAEAWNADHWAEVQIMGELNSFKTYIAPRFQDTSTYQVGDYVLYGDKFYRCDVAITQGAAFDSTQWTEVSVALDLARKFRVIDHVPTAADLTGVNGTIFFVTGGAVM